MLLGSVNSPCFHYKGSQSEYEIKSFKTCKHQDMLITTFSQLSTRRHGIIMSGRKIPMHKGVDSDGRIRNCTSATVRRLPG